MSERAAELAFGIEDLAVACWKLAATIRQWPEARGLSALEYVGGPLASDAARRTADALENVARVLADLQGDP